MTTGARGLLERDEELEGLLRGLLRARAGQGGAIVVYGPAGIGKTSLLREAVSSAREMKLTVLTGQGSELEQDFPFGVARQLLEALVTDVSGEDRTRLLAGAARLGATAIGVASDDPALQPDPAFGLLHGLYWLVANLARDGPLLLAVDDVHLADKASLRFFVYLLRRIEDLPILALFARRTGDPATDRALVDELSMAHGALSIAPRALSSDGAGRLLEAMVGVPQEDEVVTRCHGLSGGNPFLLVELARDLRSEGVTPAVGAGAPAAVTHAILVRLGRLGGDVVDLAKAVVVLGDRCALTEAAQLAGLTLETAGDAASAMMRSDILAPDGDLRFVHPLVRSAVESDLTATDRLLGHAHAARLLVEAGTSDERVATHLMLAAPQRDQRSIDALVGAANLALTRGEPEAAAARLERALLESPSDNQLLEILDAAWSEPVAGGRWCACIGALGARVTAHC